LRLITPGLFQRVDVETDGRAGRIAAGPGGQDHGRVDRTADDAAGLDADHCPHAQVARFGRTQQMGENVFQDANAGGLGGQALVAGHGDQEVFLADPGAQVAAVQVFGQLALDIGPDIDALLVPPVAGPAADGLDADDVDRAARDQLGSRQPLEHGSAERQVLVSVVAVARIEGHVVLGAGGAHRMPFTALTVGAGIRYSN
jgi:hypothetical protein